MIILGPPVQSQVLAASIGLAEELEGMLRGRHHMSGLDELFPDHPDACSYFVEDVIGPEEVQALPFIGAWRFRATCQKHGGEKVGNLGTFANDDVKARFREAYAPINIAVAQGTFLFAQNQGEHPEVPSDREKALDLGDRAAATLRLLPQNGPPRLDLMFDQGAREEVMVLATVLYELGLELARHSTPEVWTENPAKGLSISYKLTGLGLASFACEAACLPKGHKQGKLLADPIELAISLAKDCRTIKDGYTFAGNIAPFWGLLAASFAAFQIGELVNALRESEPILANQALAQRWRQHTQNRIEALGGLKGVDSRLASLDSGLNTWLPSKRLPQQRWAGRVALVAEAVQQAKMALSNIPNFKGVTF